MPRKILQINFKFHLSRAEYEAVIEPQAESIAAVPGLLWKVWLMNEAGREAGGIHLFADGPSLDAYLDGEIVAGIVGHPGLSDFSVKQFDVMDSVTAVTRGPVGRAEGG